jgi:antitoxin component of MazEF toxin-antitoxin module
MEKNFSQNFLPVEVDSVTNDYMIRIPASVMNELGWYEGTYIEMVVDGNEVILREDTEDEF